jgi:hypothetical protein
MRWYLEKKSQGVPPEYSHVKDNTHGMSTLIRMDTIDGITTYGLV